MGLLRAVAAAAALGSLVEPVLKGLLRGGLVLITRCPRGDSEACALICSGRVCHAHRSGICRQPGENICRGGRKVRLRSSESCVDPAVGSTSARKVTWPTAPGALQPPSPSPPVLLSAPRFADGDVYREECIEPTSLPRFAFVRQR